MWIKKLYATFGSLDDKTLDLRDGLNIVYGKNEAGKSTWSAFIRAMFYGISTREKAKAGYLPDKEKYRPWNGNPMYGRMELSRAGEDIEIERTSGRNGVFSKETAKNITTGAAVETGEALTGAARGVYERTAFIGQAKIGIDGDADTEKRILSLASGGDETVSAAEVKSRLEKKQREIRSPRGLGSLPEAEAEVEKLSAIISAADETEAEISEVSTRIAEISAQYKACERLIKIAEACEVRKKHEYIETAKATLAQKEQEAEAYKDYPSRAEYDSFATKSDEIKELRLKVSESEKSLSDAWRASENATRVMESLTAFTGMNEVAAKERAHSDAEKLRAASKRKVSPLGIVLASLGVILVAVGIAVNIILTVIGAAVAVVGVILAVRGGNRERKQCEEEISSRYGEASENAISEKLDRFITALHEKTAEDARIYEISVAHESEKVLMGARESDLKAVLLSYGISVDDVTAGEMRLRELVVQKEDAYRAAADARIRVEAIANTAEVTEPIEFDESEIPEESSTTIRARLEELALLKRNAELRLAALKERISGFDRAEIEKKLCDATSKAALLTRRFEAYAIALNTMAEADEEIRCRFSPEVEKRASEIFRTICGGSFEVVRIRNRDFEMDVAKGAAADPKSMLSLSQGTLDELYLALRLSLCELILDGENPPPMVLDDALVNFDDKRMAAALDMLLEISEKRQIILFSCHTREAKYFENNPKVNKIEL